MSNSKPNDLFSVGILPRLDSSSLVEDFVTGCLGRYAHSSPSLNLKDLHILIVEPDLAVADVIAFTLELEGASVQTVTSAKAAIEAIHKTLPDLLISDLVLSDADGYSLIQQIRQLKAYKTGSVPAIAIAQSAWEINRQQALSGDFQHYLFEPLDPFTLMATIAGLKIQKRLHQQVVDLVVQ
jgi:CheY-like chemotaxis protein